MAGDAEELGHHYAHHLGALRHVDACQLLDRQHVREVVHDPAQIVDPVGIGYECMPGLPFAYFLSAAVVVADI